MLSERPHSLAARTRNERREEAVLCDYAHVYRVDNIVPNVVQIFVPKGETDCSSYYVLSTADSTIFVLKY